MFCSSLAAQEFGGEPDPDVFEKQSYSPYAGRNFPDNVYWGDTHLHTTLSFDAGAFGNRLGPEDAYQFARGDEVTSTGGQQAVGASVELIDAFSRGSQSPMPSKWNPVLRPLHPRGNVL